MVGPAIRRPKRHKRLGKLTSLIPLLSLMAYVTVAMERALFYSTNPSSTTQQMPVSSTTRSQRQAPISESATRVDELAWRRLSLNRTTDNLPFPRVAFITYSHLLNMDPFEKLILPSLDTWLNNGTYFVVLTSESQSTFEESICSNTSPHEQYCSRIQPIYVDCPEGKFGQSPCCKQEQGLLQIFQIYGDSYDWYAYFDDDMYIRTKFLFRWLQPLNPSYPMVVTSGARQGESVPLGQFGYDPKQSPYNCSRDKEFTYPWGQPVIYSRVGLQRILRGLQLQGLTRQCREYNVTHDVGNAMLGWMYELPEVRVSDWDFNNVQRGGQRQAHHMAFHGIGKFARTSMTVMHQSSEALGFPLPPYTYSWHRVHGFRRTNTFRTYGDPSTWDSEWHTMPTSDCAGPQ